MTAMGTQNQCPLCRRRRAKRTCPALGHNICTVCCGTKRLSEIACPADCRYLSTAQTHPPAVVQRQRERDLRFILPLLHGLSERQQRLTLLLQQFLRSERPDAPAQTDADVSQASRALADTYETASRGIIYDHAAGLASAQRLAAELRAIVEKAESEGLAIGDADVAAAFRRIETGARDAESALGEGPSSYIQLLRRIYGPTGESPDPTDDPDRGQAPDLDPGSGLIVP